MTRKFIAFTGPRGSGKSSLISALLGVEASEKAPAYYHAYQVSGDLYALEIADSPEALTVVSSLAPRWNLEAVILVLDASQPIDARRASLYLRPLSNAKKVAVVLNKADSASEDAVKAAESIANSLGVSLFKVSCTTGEGLSELSSWLKAEKEVKPAEKREARATEAEATRPSTGTLVPSLTKPIKEIEKDAKKLGLSDEDLKVLRLVDGKRTIRDIAKELNRPPFAITVRLRRLEAAGLLRMKLVA